MNKQRKVVITVTYNDLGVIVDTKAEELDSSAQPDLQPTYNQLATDCISRQDAIDIFDDYNVSVENGELEAYSRDRKRLCDLPPAQPEPCEDAVSRKLMYELGATCMARRDENGELVALGRLDMLPSAQPEIVRCKDCRWGREVCGNIECFIDSNIPPEYHGYEWFCPNGERRTDG